MNIRSRPMRAALAAVFAIAVGLGAPAVSAGDKPAQKIKVFPFIAGDSSGFVDQRTQDLPASLKDVREAITKKGDWLELVEAKELADIVLEVTERTIVERRRQTRPTTRAASAPRRRRRRPRSTMWY